MRREDQGPERKHVLWKDYMRTQQEGDHTSASRRGRPSEETKSTGTLIPDLRTSEP